MIFMEIEKPEGTYGVVAGHIYFDCKCGSNKCHYEKSLEKDCDGEIEIAVEGAASKMVVNKESNYPDSKHTFYTSLFAFKMVLDDVDFFIEEGNFNEKGLPLICDGCKNKFVFTSELVEKLTS